MGVLGIVATGAASADITIAVAATVLLIAAVERVLAVAERVRGRQ